MSRQLIDRHRRLRRALAAWPQRLTRDGEILDHLQSDAESELGERQQAADAAVKENKRAREEEKLAAIDQADLTTLEAWDRWDQATWMSVRSQKTFAEQCREETAKTIKRMRREEKQADAKLQAAAQAARETAAANLATQQRQIAGTVAACDHLWTAAANLAATKHFNAQRLVERPLDQITQPVGAAGSDQSHASEQSHQSDDLRTASAGLTAAAQACRDAWQNLQRSRALRVVNLPLIFLGSVAIAGALAYLNYRFGWWPLTPNHLITALLIAFVGGLTLTLIIWLSSRPWLRRELSQRLIVLYTHQQQVHQHAERLRSLTQAAHRQRLETIGQNLEQQTSNLRKQTSDTIDQQQQLCEQRISDNHRHQIGSRVAAQSQFIAQEEQIAVQESQMVAEIRRRRTEQQAFIQQDLATDREEILDRQRRRGERAAAHLEHGLQSLERTARQLDSVLAPINRPWPTQPEDVKDWHSPGNSEAVIELGQISLPADSRLRRYVSSPPSAYDVPVLFRIVEDGSLRLTYASDSRSRAVELVNDWLVQAFASFLPDRFRVTLIDPVGLGRDFRQLMTLADYRGELVSHRIWTQAEHIREQLERIALRIEDAIQQRLRDAYVDIRDYNAAAGSLAQPFHLLVWSDWPAGLDETSWRHLAAILRTGGRCGVACWLLQSDRSQLPTFMDDSAVSNIGVEAKLSRDGSLTVVDEALGEQGVTPKESPSELIARRILETVGKSSLEAGRVEVAFDSLHADRQQPFGGLSDSSLEILLGSSGVDRRQFLRLGQGTAQHVLVAGKTGSGKSSLLHTLITSAAIAYSPDQLRLVLLDFKKGVEFAVYDECRLPHADIIGIESQREFGLSTLQYLDAAMQRRGEAFRRAGVQDVAAWVRQNPDTPMPRILVVVDEFQEIFTEDDRLAQEAATLLDRIVRQGRSFGIHVVLASQSLAGNYALPRTTLGQMAVRVALQCEGSDAMMILGEDNLAAERLLHPGAAILNEQAGRVEGNQPFQVAWLSKDRQRERLAQLPTDRGVSAFGGLPQPVVFDGHRPSRWDAAAVRQRFDELRKAGKASLSLVLGESVAIGPHAALTLHRQAGHNVVLVGSDDAAAAGLLRPLEQSAGFAIDIIHALRNDEHDFQTVFYELGQRADATISAADRAEAIIADYHAQLQRRLASFDSPADDVAGESDSGSRLLVILQAQRMRPLRKKDEFSFDRDAEASTADMLTDLIKEGPAVGLHLWLAVDSFPSLQRLLPRGTLGEFEFRLAMQMSQNDSNLYLDSPIANRLDPHLLLSYNDATGQGEKFRPFTPQ